MSGARRKISADRAAHVSRTMAHSKIFAYHNRVDKALDAWRDGNLTFASKLFKELSTAKEASEGDKLNWSDMTEGCKILADQVKHPDDWDAQCKRCGHQRYWHVLQVACIQCLDPDTKESSCKAFIP